MLGKACINCASMSVSGKSYTTISYVTIYCEICRMILHMERKRRTIVKKHK